MKKVLGILCIIGAIIVAIICLIAIEIKTNNKKYEEVLLNIPTKYYIEEDLEIVFISTAVIVLDYEQEDEIITYLVDVEDRQYLVLYQVKHKKGAIYNYYCWEYVSHRLL